MDKPPPETDLLAETQRFLQSAVHDLRAAQRRTNISAELLLHAADDRERSECAGQLLQGLSKTEELLTAIGKYANVLAPGSYSMKVFASITAVRFALANLDREIRDAGAIVTIGELPEVLGDRDRLAELFEHLIGNSLKFRGPDSPAVQVGARRVPEGWLFSVTDNGAGIPAKYHDRLFIAFRRLHSADVPGAGLGLAISRKIVEAHGGRIWIDHREGSGVTFSFILPTLDGV
jgi:light-regulated signal transduction histidine kinase (bacteriophytochrome)